MNQEQLHRLSCRAAQDLLQGLECGNFERVEGKLAQIRHYLTLAEMVPAASLRGAALHQREQMELLAGITERLSRALGGIRSKINQELAGLGANRNLLTHLLASASPPPRSAAGGYTSPASPTL
jgi:hypothetical protein